MKCKKCDGVSVVRFGKTIRVNVGRVQRYACNDCGHIFVDNKKVDLND